MMFLSDHFQVAMRFAQGTRMSMVYGIMVSTVHAGVVSMISTAVVMLQDGTAVLSPSQLNHLNKSHSEYSPGYDHLNNYITTSTSNSIIYGHIYSKITSVKISKNM
jgi:hypothetical protein